MDRITLFIILGAFVLFIIIVELVRRKKLEEQYSLLWLGTASGLIVLAFTRPWWDAWIVAIGITYPPTALLVAGFVAVIMILLYFSTVISKLTQQNRQAAQQIGLLELKLHELEKRIDEQRPSK
jgi:hypothetical protein